jgi:hypothetical protein
MLGFVNTQTQKKFVITSSLDKVCAELGWSKQEVEHCGGISHFMHKHENVSRSLLLGHDGSAETAMNGPATENGSTPVATEGDAI